MKWTFLVGGVMVLLITSCVRVEYSATPSARVASSAGNDAASDATDTCTTRIDLHVEGEHKFSQPNATILCDTPDLRVSAYCDNANLFVQAVIWNDDRDEEGKTEDGRRIGDWSNLSIDADANGEWTPRKDRHYSLNPWPQKPGLHYQIVMGPNASTGLNRDSAGRGAIEYFAQGENGERQVRVDTYLIPLAEIGQAAGGEIRLAYWASSAVPELTVNSVGYESANGKRYYSHSLPLDQFKSLKLTPIESPIDVAAIPDHRLAEDATPQVERVNTPPIGVKPPEVRAIEWINTESPQSLAELKGRVVLVEFWATWCGPCVKGIPHLNELHEKFGADGLTILSLTDQDRATVEAFQLKTTAPINYIVGAGSDTGTKYGVTGIPHAFIIGRDGTLKWHGHPASSECESNLEAALKVEERN